MTPPLPLRTILQPAQPEVWGFSLVQCIEYGKACAAAEQDRILRIVHEQANAYGKAGECMRIGIRAKVRNHIEDNRKLVTKPDSRPETDWSAA